MRQNRFSKLRNSIKRNTGIILEDKKANLEAGFYNISHNVIKIHNVITTNEPSENNFHTKVEQKLEAHNYWNYYTSIAME